MRSVSVHVCGLSIANIAGLLLWSSLILSKTSHQVQAAAKVEDTQPPKIGDVDPEFLLTKEEKMAFDKVYKYFCANKAIL